VAAEDVGEDIEHAHDPCEEDEELEQCEQERPIVVEHLIPSSDGVRADEAPQVGPAKILGVRNPAEHACSFDHISRAGDAYPLRMILVPA
jgi:hypothetical protein